METDTLSAISEVEQQIHDRLAAERRSAGEMLDRLREELRRQAEQDDEALAASMEHVVATARFEAEARAAAVVRSAADRAEYLERLEEGVLEPYLMKCLTAVLAGDGR